MENRDHEKVHKQEDIVKHCDSIISEIPILTVALFWSSSYMTGSSQNRDLRYNRITIFHYLHLVYVLSSRSLFSLFKLTFLKFI